MKKCKVPCSDHIGTCVPECPHLIGFYNKPWIPQLSIFVMKWVYLTLFSLHIGLLFPGNSSYSKVPMLTGAVVIDVLMILYFLLWTFRALKNASDD